MCFFEPASRVPLIVHAPRRFDHKRISQNVSLIDLFATVLDLAGDGNSPELAASNQSESFFGLLTGDDVSWHDTVLAEYTDVGAGRPWFMVKEGNYKLITDGGEASQLYDLASDLMNVTTARRIHSIERSRKGWLGSPGGTRMGCRSAQAGDHRRSAVPPFSDTSPGQGQNLLLGLPACRGRRSAVRPQPHTVSRDLRQLPPLWGTGFSFSTRTG